MEVEERYVSRMVKSAPLSRRLFIQRFSSGSLAIAALGVTAACSTDEGSGGTTTTGTGDPTPTGNITATTAAVTTTGVATTAAQTTSTTTAPAATALPKATWGRAVLGSVSAYVVVRAGEAAVIDTGFADSQADIETALGTVGITWGDVGSVIVTHSHPDHIGGLPSLLAAAPAATGYAHEADIPQIPAPRPITAVADTDTVFGLTVIHTPGHTPGHIALLEPSLRVLFAGDAINGANPGVAGPNPAYTPDMALAIESARRLGSFDYDTVVFGHGEPVIGDADAAVAAMAAGL